VLSGQTTEPEIIKLKEYFRDLTPDGRVIPHNEMESLLGLSRKQKRYDTITERWRKMVEREVGIIITRELARGEGFKVCTADQVVDLSAGHVKKAGRIMGRSHKRLGSLDDEEIKDPKNRERRRLYVECVERLVQQQRTDLRRIAAVLRKPTATLPYRSEVTVRA
jgi:hypothetical protein